MIIMSTYVKFELKTPVLHQAAEHLTGGVIELKESCINKSGEIGLRCLVSSPCVEEFERGLRSDETVSRYDVLAQPSTDETLYQIQLSKAGRENSIVPLLGEYGGELIEGKRSGEQCFISLRFPDHASLQDFINDYRSRQGISLQVTELGPETESHDYTYGLTQAQYEALYVAYKQGYFEVPRRASLVSLSDELGVSDNAVSERLRRAQRKICSRLFHDIRSSQ